MNSSLLLVGIALCCACNFIVLVVKLKKRRFLDFAVDCGLFVAICWLFSITFNALVVGTFASAFISLWLFFFPVRWNDFASTKKAKAKSKKKKNNNRSITIEWL